MSNSPVLIAHGVGKAADIRRRAAVPLSNSVSELARRSCRPNKPPARRCGSRRHSSVPTLIVFTWIGSAAWADGAVARPPRTPSKAIREAAPGLKIDGVEFLARNQLRLRFLVSSSGESCLFTSLPPIPLVQVPTGRHSTLLILSDFARPVDGRKLKGRTRAVGRRGP